VARRLYLYRAILAGGDTVAPPERVRRAAGLQSGDYWRLNAQMAYSPPDTRYTITVYGTNLTDEYELNSGFCTTSGSSTSRPSIDRVRSASASK
jgi:outer membrane receptor protein involved in Fe transport